jgi:hypothetical protein
MSATRKTIKSGENKKGTCFALCQFGSTFEVWKLCSNYDGRMKGGIATTWRYVRRAMDETTARDLFARRLAGTAR